MKRFLLILLILPLFTFAQRKKDRDTSAVILQPNRIEFEYQKEASEFYVVPGDLDGLLVVEETMIATRPKGNIWKIHLIDTAFQITWSKELVIPTDGALLGYEYFEGDFYLLFIKSRFRSEDLLVYKFESG